MRAVVKVKRSQGRAASNAARYIAESKIDSEREGKGSRPLFTNREDDDLSYRRANSFLTGRGGAPTRNDLIHFSVSFRTEDFEALGATVEERKQRLREIAREAMEEVKGDLRAAHYLLRKNKHSEIDWRWVAGIHLNTTHPHLHFLVFKEITDETGKTHRLGRIPKRLLPYRERSPDGVDRPVEGVIGRRFVDAIERARAREAVLEREAPENMARTLLTNTLEFDQPLVYQGIEYRTVENFYQAMKAAKSDLETRRKIASAAPDEARRLGEQIKIRPDWQAIHWQVMETALKHKFTPGTTWYKKLLATGDREIRDGSSDNFLGHLLMKLRREARTPPVELLLEANERNPSQAGRELVRDFILRDSKLVRAELFNPASDLRQALTNRSLDDPNYRTQSEQADWLGRHSPNTRDLYERGAEIKGDVLVIPAEEHEIPDEREGIRVIGIAHAYEKIGDRTLADRKLAAEFHRLGRAIAGESADIETEIKVFKHYFDQIEKDAEGRQLYRYEKDYNEKRNRAIERTLAEMRFHAAEMAQCETRESVEVASPVVDLSYAYHRFANPHIADEFHTLAVTIAGENADARRQTDVFAHYYSGLEKDRDGHRLLAEDEPGRAEAIERTLEEMRETAARKTSPEVLETRAPEDAEHAYDLVPYQEAEEREPETPDDPARSFETEPPDYEADERADELDLREFEYDLAETYSEHEADSLAWRFNTAAHKADLGPERLRFPEELSYETKQRPVSVTLPEIDRRLERGDPLYDVKDEKGRVEERGIVSDSNKLIYPERDEVLSGIAKVTELPRDKSRQELLTQDEVVEVKRTLARLSLHEKQELERKRELLDNFKFKDEQERQERKPHLFNSLDRERLARIENLITELQPEPKETGAGRDVNHPADSQLYISLSGEKDSLRLPVSSISVFDAIQQTAKNAGLSISTWKGKDGPPIVSGFTEQEYDERVKTAAFLKSYVHERLRDPETRLIHDDKIFRDAHGLLERARTLEEVDAAARQILLDDSERRRAPASHGARPFSNRERNFLFHGRAPDHYTPEMIALRHTWGLPRKDRIEALRAGGLAPSPVLKEMLGDLQTRATAKAIGHFRRSILNPPERMDNPSRLPLYRMHQQLLGHERDYIYELTQETNRTRLAEEINRVLHGSERPAPEVKNHTAGPSLSENGRVQTQPEVSDKPARGEGRQSTTANGSGKEITTDITEPSRTNGHTNGASLERNGDSRGDWRTRFLAGLGAETRERLVKEVSPWIDTLVEIEKPKRETFSEIDKQIYYRPLPKGEKEKTEEIGERRRINAFLKAHVEERIKDPKQPRLDEIAHAAQLVPPREIVTHSLGLPGAERESDRFILGDAVITRVLHDCAALDHRIARDHGETFRFKVRDESVKGVRRISALDVERRAEAGCKRLADERGATAHDDRREIRERYSAAETARHSVTLEQHAHRLKSLVKELEAKAEDAGEAREAAERKAGQVLDRYGADGEKPPLPLVLHKKLVEAQDEAVKHGFAHHVESLERLRIALGKERGVGMRDDKEAARLAAQLFVARTELKAAEERADRSDRTRHLRQWEIGAEKWSLADLDRRIERTTDQMQLVGRREFHILPGARREAAGEAERLAGIRQQVLGKIAETNQELRDKVDEAGRLENVLSRIYEREKTLRERSGLAMPEPQFTREELDRAGDGIETARDVEMLRRLAAYENRFNSYADRKQRFEDGETHGRAAARLVLADIFHRESTERLESFRARSELQPLLIEIPDGRLITKGLKDVEARSLAEFVARPLVETPSERELREAVRAAHSAHEKLLIAEAGKTNIYLGEAQVIAGESPAQPAFTPKQAMEIEIYAEGRTDKREREHLLALARGGGHTHSDSHTRTSSRVPDAVREIATSLGRGR